MPEKQKDWEGDWEGACRVCWRVRNLGPDYRPTDVYVTCGLKNPDGSACTGVMLIGMTQAAALRRRALHRAKKLVPKGKPS